MRRLLSLLGVAALAAFAPSCSTQELADVEARAKTDAVKLAHVAQATLEAFEAHEVTIDEAVAAVVSAAPPTGALHDLAVDAEATAEAIRDNPEAREAIKAELARIAPVSTSSAR